MSDDAVAPVAAAPSKMPTVAVVLIGAGALFTLSAFQHIALAVGDAADGFFDGTGVATRAALTAGSLGTLLTSLLGLMSLGAYAGWRKVAPMLGGGGPTAQTDRLASFVGGALAAVSTAAALIAAVGLFGLGDTTLGGQPHLRYYGEIVETLVVGIVIAAGSFMLARVLRPRPVPPAPAPDSPA